jgi:hypothetical protein
VLKLHEIIDVDHHLLISFQVTGNDDLLATGSDPRHAENHPDLGRELVAWRVAIAESYCYCPRIWQCSLWNCFLIILCPV